MEALGWAPVNNRHRDFAREDSPVGRQGIATAIRAWEGYRDAAFSQIAGDDEAEAVPSEDDVEQIIAEEEDLREDWSSRRYRRG